MRFDIMLKAILLSSCISDSVDIQDNEQTKKEQIFTLASAQRNSSDSKNLELTDTVSNARNISLDSLWYELVFINGGCLSGGEHVYNGRFGNEGCVMSDYRYQGEKWKIFFSNHSEKELLEFLLPKFSDTSTTKIHTCPCMPATNGEVAVYALHKIFKLNWYDLDGFQEYSIREGSGCTDSEQSWLLAILSNKKQVKQLMSEWKKQLE